MKEAHPYYHTWSKQSDYLDLPIQKVNSSTFTLENQKIDVIDLSSQSLHASLGLNPKLLIKAIQKQAENLLITSSKYKYALKTDTTNELLKFIEKSPVKGGKILYTVSGAESIENALKMARQITQKNIILSSEASYHGASLGAAQITGDWRGNKSTYTSSFNKKFDGKFTPNSLIQIEEYLKQGNIAAVCLEPISGVNGVYIPQKDWFEKLQTLLDKYNCLLILDEVVTGFYRTGKAMGFHHYPKLKPDFICMAKSINCGAVPFGALWTSKKVAQYFDKTILSCGLTNYAHSLGLASTQAVLKFLSKSKKDIKAREKIFTKSLRSLEQLSAVKHIRFKGMLAAIELNSPLSLPTLLADGIHLIVRDNMLILAPALNIKLNELHKGLSRLENILLKQGDKNG